MRNSPFWWILIIFMVLLDFYVFQVVKVLSQSAGSKSRMLIYGAYWFVSAMAILILVLLPYLNFDSLPKGFRNTLFAVIVGFFFAKLVASVFFLVDDVRRGLQWAGMKIFNSEADAPAAGEEGITRSAFLSWFGVAIGGGLFASLIYGFNNRYRYQLKRFRFDYASLPLAFDGLRIVHISDIHSGSFNDRDAVIEGVQQIMDQKPDLILFTGDLVNDRSDEMKDYIDVFSRLKAPLGVFSILGNHDYGDYVQWESTEAKQKNLEALKSVHARLGWRLLMNENVKIEREGQCIALIGVENWSTKARFPKYGDLRKAYEGAASYPFKILMSHDPSHWDGEVKTKYPDIDLMLAGHTHGMQFGVEIPGFKWSPVQYMYRQWAGLYEEGLQKLYINRGFGFIGYPGRVGILPEITVIDLHARA